LVELTFQITAMQLAPLEFEPRGKLFHVEQFGPGAMFAILSSLFVGSALLPVISICVGLMAFVHRQKLQNPDIQKEFKNGWLARFLFRKGGFVRVTLIVRFVT
jgi:hypothetical protein